MKSFWEQQVLKMLTHLKKKKAGDTYAIKPASYSSCQSWTTTAYAIVLYWWTDMVLDLIYREEDRAHTCKTLNQ